MSNLVSRLLIRWNPIYVGGRVIRRWVPNWLSRRISYRDNTIIEYLLDIFQRQKEALENHGVSLSRATILEIGPGMYNPSAALFLAYGAAKVILVESVQIGYKSKRWRKRTRLALENLGRRNSTIFRALDSEHDENSDSLKVSRPVEGVELLWCDASKTPLPDNSVDIVLSNAVFEHLSEPEAVLQEMYRVMKPNGIMFHRVNLQDHFPKASYQFLFYSKRFWNRWLTRENRTYLNRLRAHEFTRLLDLAGFDSGITIIDSGRKQLKRIRPYLDEHFAQMSDEQLEPLLIDIFCRARG